MADRATKKVAVVTGASGGVGRSVVDRLSREGYTVAAIGRRPARGGRHARAAAGATHAYTCDVADRAQVKATVRAILKDLGRIDAVVNTAAIVRRETMAKITPEAIADTLGVNLLGTMNVALACVPALKRSRGTIVNLSSALTHHPIPGLAVYTTSKGAVESFTKALAVELAPAHVRANALSLAALRSGIFRAEGTSDADYRKTLARASNYYPLKRIGEPGEVAAMIAFLVGPESSWITGTIIPVDGGKSIA